MSISGGTLGMDGTERIGKDGSLTDLLGFGLELGGRGFHREDGGLRVSDGLDREGRLLDVESLSRHLIPLSLVHFLSFQCFQRSSFDVVGRGTLGLFQLILDEYEDHNRVRQEESRSPVGLSVVVGRSEGLTTKNNTATPQILTYQRQSHMHVPHLEFYEFTIKTKNFFV